jgi:hypothetical protein
LGWGPGNQILAKGILISDKWFSPPSIPNLRFFGTTLITGGIWHEAKFPFCTASLK